MSKGRIFFCVIFLVAVTGQDGKPIHRRIFHPQFSEIYARGKFQREEVVRALEANDGDADKAFLQLNRFQLHPFLTKIWQPQQVLGHLARLWHPNQVMTHLRPHTLITHRECV